MKGQLLAGVAIACGVTCIGLILALNWHFTRLDAVLFEAEQRADDERSALLHRLKATRRTRDE